MSTNFYHNIFLPFFCNFLTFSFYHELKEDCFHLLLCLLEVLVLLQKVQEGHFPLAFLAPQTTLLVQEWLYNKAFNHQSQSITQRDNISFPSCK